MCVCVCVCVCVCEGGDCCCPCFLLSGVILLTYISRLVCVCRVRGPKRGREADDDVEEEEEGEDEDEAVNLVSDEPEGDGGRAKAVFLVGAAKQASDM